MKQTFSAFRCMQTDLVLGSLTIHYILVINQNDQWVLENLLSFPSSILPFVSYNFSASEYLGRLFFFSYNFWSSVHTRVKGRIMIMEERGRCQRWEKVSKWVQPLPSIFFFIVDSPANLSSQISQQQFSRSSGYPIFNICLYRSLINLH